MGTGKAIIVVRFDCEFSNVRGVRVIDFYQFAVSLEDFPIDCVTEWAHSFRRSPLLGSLKLSR